MPVPPKDLKRASAHRNPEIGAVPSKYDTVFSSAKHIDMYEMLGFAVRKEAVVPFVVFLAAFIIMLSVVKLPAISAAQPVQVVAYVAEFFVMWSIATFVSEAWISRSSHEHGYAKSILVNLMVSFFLFVAAMFIYVALFEVPAVSRGALNGASPSIGYSAGSVLAQLFLLLFAWLAYYVSIRYSLAPFARMVSGRQAKWNSFDMSWHLLDNSIQGYLLLSTIFAFFAGALVLAAAYYEPTAPASMAVVIVLALLAAMFEAGRDGVFSSLYPSLSYYNPQA